jgi:coenzyme F420-0:L-glutamate ligase / coenzyme F420-1:gamma-L-glutamate ligase
MFRRMTLTALAGIPAIAPGDDLAALMIEACERTDLVLEDGDILVLAQKIVSKAEDRSVSLRDLIPSPRAIELAAVAQKDPRVVELILRESTSVLRCRAGVIIVEHRSGLVMANAGIDASNVDGADGEDRVLLLPKDPDRSAAALRDTLRSRINRDIGIVINDSFGRAWRNGTIGTAIGVAGPPALWDMRGLPDMNGRVLRATEVGIADELAAAASLLMGQGSEGLPAIHVSGFPLAFRPSSAAELIRSRDIDLFR